MSFYCASLGDSFLRYLNTLFSKNATGELSQIQTELPNGCGKRADTNLPIFSPSTLLPSALPQSSACSIGASIPPPNCLMSHSRLSEDVQQQWSNSLVQGSCSNDRNSARKEPSKQQQHNLSDEVRMTSKEAELMTEEALDIRYQLAKEFLDSMLKSKFTGDQSDSLLQIPTTGIQSRLRKAN